MTTQTMSIAEALGELKLLDKRIYGGIDNIQPLCIGYCYPSTEKQKQQQEKFVKDAESSFQSINGLISRYAAIKGAIVVSNATTIVTIAGKEYTVAAAIELKKRIERQQRLVSRLSNLLSSYKRRLEDVQAKYETNLNNFLNNSVSDKSQLKDPQLVASLTEGYARSNSQELIDPLNLQTNLGLMQEEIDAFTGGVDMALTRSNVITLIEVPV